jgi:hypothetical protein
MTLWNSCAGIFSTNTLTPDDTNKATTMDNDQQSPKATNDYATCAPNRLQDTQHKVGGPAQLQDSCPAVRKEGPSTQRHMLFGAWLC